MKSIFSYFSSGFIHVCVFPWFPGQKCGSCFWCDLILLSGSHIVPFSLRRKGPVKHTHKPVSGWKLYRAKSIYRSLLFMMRPDEFFGAQIETPGPPVLSICNKHDTYALFRLILLQNALNPALLLEDKDGWTTHCICPHAELNRYTWCRNISPPASCRPWGAVTSSHPALWTCWGWW